jgi:hypothetical protein
MIASESPFEAPPDLPREGIKGPPVANLLLTEALIEWKMFIINLLSIINKSR